MFNKCIQVIMAIFAALTVGIAALALAAQLNLIEPYQAPLPQCPVPVVLMLV